MEYPDQCKGSRSAAGDILWNNMAMQIPVEISWDSQENAEKFTVQINNNNNECIDIAFSLTNHVIVTLPYYGYYSVNICSVNRCGNTCLDSIFELKKPNDTMSCNRGEDEPCSIRFYIMLSTGIILS